MLIKEEVKRKVFEKHGVYFEEVKHGFVNGKPVIYKTKEEKYLAITHHHRYITIIFTYKDNNANIITAYPSPKWQIRLYKKKN